MHLTRLQENNYLVENSRKCFISPNDRAEITNNVRRMCIRVLASGSLLFRVSAAGGRGQYGRLTRHDCFLVQCGNMKVDEKTHRSTLGYEDTSNSRPSCWWWRCVCLSDWLSVCLSVSGRVTQNIIAPILL